MSSSDDLNERCEALMESFRQRLGRVSEGVWCAPGRVNLIGEHTDYNDGFALPFALSRVTLAAVARRHDGVVRCLSEGFDQVEVVLDEVSPTSPPPGWAVYPVGVAWALRQLGVDVSGFDLMVASDVPGGAGVSSSAALECSVSLALADLHDTEVDRRTLAAVGRRAENEIAGAPTGVMDQMVSLLAEDGHALLLDCRSLAATQVPFNPAAAAASLLVIDTKVKHALVGGEYGERRAACEEAAAVLGVPALRDSTMSAIDAAAGALGPLRTSRARHVVSENSRVLDVVALLEHNDLQAVGPHLSASHASLRDDFEVSCPELDVACAAAEAAGAWGARMTGGGFGGSAIALVPRQLVAAVTLAVEHAAATAGYPTPEVFAAEPAAGARRLR